MNKPMFFYTAILSASMLLSCSNENQNTAMNDQQTEQVQASQAAGSIYDFNLKSIDGKDVSLSQFKGKKILIVNVASECGLTPQYVQLEELYKKYGDKLVIL